MKEGKTLRRLLVPFEYDRKRITKDRKGKLYEECILLNEGEFADSVSRAPVVYTKEQLMQIPNNLHMKSEYFPLDDDKIYLNVDHKPMETLSRIGYVPNIYYTKGALRGDIYLHCLTQNSNEIKTLIDSGYVNSLSVEIMTSDRYGDDGRLYAEDIVLIGLAVVLAPACTSTKIK